MKLYLFFVITFLLSFSTKAQYLFSGKVDQDHIENNVYLSLIEDYRKLSGVFSEQIISKQKIDSFGRFQFLGNQLDDKNQIYRIHVDSCKEEVQNQPVNNLTSEVYFDGNDIQLKLQKAIATLPQKQQIVFNMKYFDDLKYKDMSDILETSEGALKASYHIAVKKIEAYLTGN